MRLITPPKIPETEYQKATRGKVMTGIQEVEGFKSKKVYGVAVVDVPIAKIWAAVNDDLGKVQHTKLEYAEIVAGKACSSGRRVFQYLPLPMVANRWWISDFQENQPLQIVSSGRVREVRWKTTSKNVPTETAKKWAKKGMPVEFNEGGWLLIDVDGKTTIIEYYAWSDPGGYLPAGLTNSLAEGGIKHTVKAVESLAIEGPSCPIQ